MMEPWGLSWFICGALILLATIVVFRPRPLKLPPGPKPWPIIGNLKLIGPLPHITMHELSRRYGPIMQIYIGSAPMVIGSSIDMAKQFLKHHDLSFASRPKSAAGLYTAYDHRDVTWAPYGPYLRQARKLYLNELFSAKRLEAYEYIRVEELRGFLSGIYTSCSKPIAIRDHLSKFMLNNICRMVLGKQYLGSKPGIPTPEQYKEMLEEWFELNGVLNIGDYMPWINFLDLQGYVKRMKAFEKKLDHFLEHVIDDHVSIQQGKGQYAEDLVHVLLKLSQDPDLEVKLSKIEIKALIQDLLSGGSDTSSLTIEWGMVELLKWPNTLERAKEELDRVIGRNRWVTEKDIQNLPYIEAIAKEAMRMHPASPMLAQHVARKNCKVGGYDIIKGTRLFVNVWTIMRDPKLWDAPIEFRPERFIGSHIDVKGHHFELIPFGTGRRMCPGYPLGLKLIQNTMANLIHGFNWKLPDNMKPEDLNMEETWGLVVPKKYPLIALAEPRLPIELYSH